MNRTDQIAQPSSSRGVLAAVLLALLAFAGSGASAAAAECPNEQLRQQQGSTSLPDCMALELVSPPVKGNRGTVSINTPSISADGDRVQFETNATVGETEGLLNPLGDRYLAGRGSEGWSTWALAPPAAYGFGYGGVAGTGNPRGFSPDFARWLSIQATVPQALNGRFTIYEADLGGAWTPRSPLLVSSDGFHGFSLPTTAEGKNFPGVSADFSHLYFRPTDGASGASAYSVAYLPGDPQPLQYTDGTWNTYVLARDGAGETSLALMARDSNGKAWGGNCGAWVGGGGNPLNRGLRNQGAVSADGAYSYFSTRPTEKEGVPCPVTGTAPLLNPASNEVTVNGATQPFSVGQEISGGSIPPGTTISAVNGQVLTLSANPASVQISGISLTAHSPIRIMERSEEAGGEVTISELLPSTPALGSDYFEGASVDQSKVYFTSSRKLAASDEDPSAEECSEEVKLPTASSVGCDLYLYEKLPGGGHEVILVSEGGTGDPTPGAGANVYKDVTAISGDGSHVYFAAQGELTTDPNPLGEHAEAGKLNLYLYERDAAHPGGRLAFVGRLDSACTKLGGTVVADCGLAGGGSLVGSQMSYYNNASAVPLLGSGDGHVLFFESTAPLTANDTDGNRLDLFRYDSSLGGPGALQCVSCRPGGPDGGAFDLAVRDPGLLNPGPEFAESQRWTSEDGEDAVFATSEALLPEDVDGERSDYLWQNGQLSLLPGHGEKPAISHDGKEVAFETSTALLPQDGDSATDVYLARVNGGFPNPQAAAAPCEGEACRGQATSAPGPLAVASATFAGKGNAKQARKHHRKKRHHHHRKIKRGHHHGGSGR